MSNKKYSDFTLETVDPAKIALQADPTTGALTSFLISDVEPNISDTPTQQPGLISGAGLGSVIKYYDTTFSALAASPLLDTFSADYIGYIYSITGALNGLDFSCDLNSTAQIIYDPVNSLGFGPYALLAYLNPTNAARFTSDSVLIVVIILYGIAA